MSDQIIKTVKFRSEFEAAKEFDKWLKDQEKHLDMSLDNAFNKNVRAYQAKMEAINKALEEAGDNPSDAALASMHKSLKEMVPLAKQLSTQFSKLKLGKELSEELEKANQEYVSLQNKIKKTESLKKRMKSTTITDGAKLNKEELTKIYKNTIAKSETGLKVGEKTYGGQDGLGIEQFIEDFRKDSEAFYKAKGEFEAVAQKLQTEVQAQIESKLNTYEQRFEAQTQALEEAGKALDEARNKAEAVGRGKQAEAAVAGNTAALNLGTAVTDTDKNSKPSSTKTATEEIKTFNKENKKTPGIIKKAATQVLTYGTVISLFKRSLSEAKRTITELDKALTDMAIVTNLTREQAWKMVDSLQAIAKETGTTTTVVAGTVTKFLQQGKSMTQATQMAEAALMAASIAGIDASRSVDLLTNAMNGFQLSASQALEVSDKFAALAAASATDYEELAVALSKVAAQANLAGMSMDFTLGMLAKGIEVTREAPETIGTALKTVISRMRELTDYGETLEEGMDVNRVETALKNVGVQLRDTNGQFRNLEDVLSELGGKWNTLNVNQQANVAVALAGTRQQSRLIAMMQDFDRTLELVDISTNSYGATMAQQAEYMGSLEAAMNQLTTAYEGLITNLSNSEVIVTIVNGLASTVELAGKLLSYNVVLIPLLVLAGNYVMAMLANKIRQHHYDKLNLKLQKEKQKQINKERLAEIEVRKAILTQYKTNLQNNKAKEEGLQTKLEEAALEAEQNGNSVLALKYRQQIKELTKDNVQEEMTLKEVEAELNVLEAEKTNLIAEQNFLTSSQTGLMGVLQGSFIGSISLISSMVMGIVNAVIATKALVAAKKTEEKQTKKNTVAILAEAAGRKIAAAFGMAGSAAWIPYVGWGIGLAILGAILGTAIAIGAIAKHNKKDDTKSIEGNIKAVQKLQAELYNLGQTQKVVSGLVDEFDSLASKINQSAEDLSRLTEIIQEFNDSVGFEMIAPGTDATTALAIMRGYETMLSHRMEQILLEANETFAKAVTDGDTLKAYMQNAEGTSVVRQLVSQNYAEFAEASNTTQKLILDLLAAGKFASAQGIDYEGLKNAFTANDIALLDEAVASGSLEQYGKVLERLSKGAQNYLENMTGVFKAVQGYNTDILAQVDALKLNADQLERFGPILAKILSKQKKSDDKTTTSIKELYEKRMDAFAYKNQGDIDAAKQDAQDGINTIKNNEWYQNLIAIPEDERTEDHKQQLATFASAIGAYQNVIDDANEAQYYLNMGATEFFNIVGNTQSLTDLQNEITKTSSHLDQLGKLMRGELHGPELDTLLNAYPDLIKYLDDGKFDAADYVAASAEMQSKLENALQTNVTKTRDTFELEFEAGWREQNPGKMFDSNIFKSITTTAELESAITNFSDEAKETIRNAWYQYAANKLKMESGMLSDEAWDRIGKSTGSSLAQAQIEQYKEELSRYSKDEAGYQAAFDKYTNSLDVGLRIAKQDKDNAKKEIDTALKQFKDQYAIINGEIFGKEGNTLKALSEIDNVALRNALASVEKGLIEAYSNADETIIANAEARAEAYADIQKEQWEKEVEIIEKKKEAYEEYFDEIDTLAEEQERQQSKEDIIKQLSALSTGVDGTTKSKIKDLQGQLNDLIDEEQKAAREEARNEFLKDLDDQAAVLNNSMKDLDDSIGMLTRAFIGATGADIEGFKYDSASELSYVNQLANFLHNKNVPGFSTGGLVNYTGLAMVHGSQTRPEAFLSADDTDLISNLVEVLHLIFDDINPDGSGDVVSNNSSSITIENINIKTEQLNNTQDFSNAGKTLAQEFAAVIRERGLNVNVRK